MATTTEDDRSLGRIVKELTTDITTLFRSEIALLKLEIKDTVAKLAGGLGMFAGAVCVALVGVAFAFVTLVLVLIRLGLPPWVAALIVTVLLFVTAGVLAFFGKRKFEAVNFVPAGSVEQIKGDIESIKADIARVRSR